MMLRSPSRIENVFGSDCGGREANGRTYPWRRTESIAGGVSSNIQLWICLPRQPPTGWAAVGEQCLSVTSPPSAPPASVISVGIRRVAASTPRLPSPVGLAVIFGGIIPRSRVAVAARTVVVLGLIVTKGLVPVVIPLAAAVALIALALVPRVMAAEG